MGLHDIAGEVRYDYNFGKGIDWRGVIVHVDIFVPERVWRARPTASGHVEYNGEDGDVQDGEAQSRPRRNRDSDVDAAPHGHSQVTRSVTMFGARSVQG